MNVYHSNHYWIRIVGHGMLHTGFKAPIRKLEGQIYVAQEEKEKCAQQLEGFTALP